MSVFDEEDCCSDDQRRKKYLIGRWQFALIALFGLLTISSVQADEWVTAKTQKPGHKFLGQVIFTVEIRSDGTVKNAWPTAASASSRTAWRAVRSVKQLQFPRGAKRKEQIRVTIYLE